MNHKRFFRFKISPMGCRPQEAGIVGNRKLRQTLTERGAWANIKPMPHRRNIPAFSAFLYRYRNLVERFFNKLKHFRAVATRYDKSPENFLASVKLASARIWMRFNESMT